MGRENARPDRGAPPDGPRLRRRRGRLLSLGALELSVSDQWYYIVLAGAGVGLVLSPANTDALNRVSRDRYGEATGITQTVRNFGSSLGLAVLGSILILENRSNLEATADKSGIPKQVGSEIADQISQGTGGGESPEHLPTPI